MLRETTLLLLYALAGTPQDPEVQDLLDRMAARTEKIAALEWRASTWLDWRDYTDRGNSALGRFARSEGLRTEVTIVSCSEPEEHRPEFVPNRFMIAWTPDGLSVAFGTLLMEEATALGPPHLLLRAKKGDPALAAVDPHFLIPMLPILILMNSPILCATLDPHLIFEYQPPARLVGRERFSDRDCFRLDVRHTVGDQPIPRVWYRVREQEKSYYVNVDSFLIEGVVYRQTVDLGTGSARLVAVSKVESRIAGGDHAGLPLEVTTQVTMDNAPGMVTAFRQTIQYRPEPPPPRSIAGWEADASQPAGSLACVDAAPSQGAVDSYLRQAYTRAIACFGWSATGRADVPADDVLLRAMREAAALAPDAGSVLANLHWFLARWQKHDEARKILERAQAAQRLTAGDAAYFARALLSDRHPEAALRLLDRAGRPPDPFLRAQVSIDRMRALLALDRPEAVIEEFAAATKTFGSFEEKLHYLKHAADVAARLRADATARRHATALKAALNIMEGDPIFDVARAAWAAWEDPDAERRILERLLDASPSDPHLRHLYLRCAWRQMATRLEPELAVWPNGKLGPLGQIDRWERALEPRRREQARAFSERTRLWAEKDPRAAFLAGLGLIRSGAPSESWPWFEKALNAAIGESDDPVRLHGTGRVTSEIAQYALRHRRLDVLERTARVWLDVMERSQAPDPQFCEEETLPPLLFAGELLDQGKYAQVFRLLKVDHRFYVGAARMLSEKLAKIPPDRFVDAVLAEWENRPSASQALSLRSWMRQYTPHSEEVTRTLARALGRVSDPDERLSMTLAQSWMQLGDVAKAVLAAEQAYGRAPDDERVALFFTRLLVLNGQSERARAVLTGFLATHRVVRPFHVGRALEEAEAFESALEQYEAALKAGARPWLALGPLYERLERWDDAMRCYNRALASDADWPKWEEIEELPDSPSTHRLAPTPSQGRARILAKLGQDHYIDKLLSAPMEPGPEAAARVTELLKTIESSTEPRARQQAWEELRGFDRNVAKLVHPLLRSDDPTVAAFARELLGFWAEPR
ncbi:MAG: hypothetical protein HYY16_16560 [Planctomycetes bacterium]|nr:hypothetical protein [Planctomycetota bacterium]